MPLELQKEITLPVDSKSLLPMRAFLGRCMDEAEVAAKDRRPVMAAVDEVLNSTLIGGKEDGRRGNLRVIVEVNSTRLRLVVYDESEGAEHRPGADEGVMQLASHARRDLGLGVLRRVMDEVRYNYRRGFQNELELVKFL